MCNALDPLDNGSNEYLEDGSNAALYELEVL